MRRIMARRTKAAAFTPLRPVQLFARSLARFEVEREAFLATAMMSLAAATKH